MKQTILNNLLSTAEKFPHKTALHHNDKTISYESLWQDVLGLTTFLVDNGFKKGERVALIQENSIEYVIVYYAVLAAGGIIIGLNTSAKSSDIINWLQHSDASWMFIQSKYTEINQVLDQSKIRHVVIGENFNQVDSKMGLESFTEILENSNAEKFNLDIINIKESDPAAIIYTSGTTGKPKGVTLSHNNLKQNIDSINSYLNLSSKDSILNILPFYYSYGNSILHTHIAVGATIYLENSFMFPKKVIEQMEKHKVTGFSGVPSTYAILLSRTQLDNVNLQQLRYVTQAGGPMPPANISEFKQKVPSAKFIVMYGQTEATARISYLPPENLEKKLGSIGFAIPGVEIEIRDEEGNKVSENEKGELFVKGPNIMLGYWKNDSATQQVIKDGWLKTGDLGSCDKDGYIYLSGRMTDMIKVSGHRISPLEIEEVIAQLDDVEEVVAVGVADEMTGQLIKVVIVLKEGATMDEKNIKAHCRKNIAMYKIPKHIVFADTLPKTASGKVQRYLL